ncbi:hypothetical protein C8R44DRAFT_724240 [Mycena epipterygia]|nr:hypothetical protein C8R44DRAFT_724240 [Mycena epipterygia]
MDADGGGGVYPPRSGSRCVNKRLVLRDKLLSAWFIGIGVRSSGRRRCFAIYVEMEMEKEMMGMSMEVMGMTIDRCKYVGIDASAPPRSELDEEERRSGHGKNHRRTSAGEWMQWIDVVSGSCEWKMDMDMRIDAYGRRRCEEEEMEARRGTWTAIVQRTDSGEPLSCIRTGSGERGTIRQGT